MTFTTKMSVTELHSCLASVAGKVMSNPQLSYAEDNPDAVEAVGALRKLKPYGIKMRMEPDAATESIKISLTSVGVGNFYSESFSIWSATVEVEDVLDPETLENDIQHIYRAFKKDFHPRYAAPKYFQKKELSMKMRAHVLSLAGVSEEEVDAYFTRIGLFF